MEEHSGGDNVVIEFKATMLLLLDLLEHGETQRAIDTIKKILNDK